MAEADPTDRYLVAAEPLDLPNDTKASPLRKKLLTGITAAVLLAGLGYGGWYTLSGSHHVETENAYVGADTVQVTPMISGQAIQVLASDTLLVKRGDVLLRLDDSDAQIALATAQAELAKASRQFGQTAATSSALLAEVNARRADIDSARAQLVSAGAAFTKAQVDYNRRQKLAANGAVSGDELTSATSALASARASFEQARATVVQTTAQRDAASGTFAANQALIQGVTAENEPGVLAAKARVRQAELDLARTVIRASIDGVVTNRTVQLGQRVAPGSTMMQIVPINQLYVDANFKEGQLSRVKPGQIATLTSDIYGNGVTYHGRVVGFSGGTGSAFALIPAQNATGNWIKVVQRLPVRIALDPKELTAHPLRVGLSMTAKIDTD